MCELYIGEPQPLSCREATSLPQPQSSCPEATSLPQQRRRRQQRGGILVWVLVSLVAILAVAAFAIDADFWYERRAEAQRVADCAALTYAYVYSTTGSQTSATTAFDNVITKSGYSSADTTNNYVTNPYKGNSFWFHVHVGRTEHQAFSG